MLVNKEVTANRACRDCPKSLFYKGLDVRDEVGTPRNVERDANIGVWYNNDQRILAEVTASIARNRGFGVEADHIPHTLEVELGVPDEERVGWHVLVFGLDGLRAVGNDLHVTPFRRVLGK